MASYEDERPVAPNDLTAIHNRIEATSDLLRKISEGLCTTADRVFGAQPAMVSGNGVVTPPTNGQIEDITRGLDRLQNATQALVEHAARFHRL